MILYQIRKRGSAFASSMGSKLRLSTIRDSAFRIAHLKAEHEWTMRDDGRSDRAQNEIYTGAPVV